MTALLVRAAVPGHRQEVRRSTRRRQAGGHVRPRPPCRRSSPWAPSSAVEAHRRGDRGIHRGAQAESPGGRGADPPRRAHAGKGQTDSSLQFAQDAAKSLPNDPAVQLTLVRSLLAKGQMAQAEEMTRGVRAEVSQRCRRPDDVRTGAAREARYGRRPCGLHEGRYALNPNDYESVAGLAALDLVDKKPEAARARDGSVPREEPDQRARPGVLRARVLGCRRPGQGRGGAPQGHRPEPERSQRLQPPRRDLRGAEAHAGGAWRRWRRSSRRTPRPSAPTRSSGCCYELQGDRASARQRYEQILQIDPTAPVASNNLAYIYAESGGQSRHRAAVGADGEAEAAGGRAGQRHARDGST